MEDNNIYVNLFNGDNMKITANIRNKNGRTIKKITINSDGNISIEDKEDKNNG